jgi:hypothetical protein
VLPDTNVELIVLLTEDPAVTEAFPELLREKLKAGAGAESAAIL